VADDHFSYYYGHSLTNLIPNDGRPDFASNPWNGPAPTFEQAIQRLCTAASPDVLQVRPSCLRRSAPSTAARVYMSDYRMPHSHQASAGVQRQIGTTMSFSAD
jgi:hypothetical protein